MSRGCSSFITDGLVEYEAETEDFEGNPYTYSITKESCSNGPNCNLAGDAPGNVWKFKGVSHSINLFSSKSFFQQK